MWSGSLDMLEHARPAYVDRYRTPATKLDVDVHPVLDHLALGHLQQGQAG
jgi:hypothetical protein